LAIEHIHTYLVHPGKGSENAPQIGGANVPLNGQLFNLLGGIYAKSDVECDIEISFNQSEQGTQNNPCRDLIVAYLSGPTIPRGRHIADRLELATTHRSGLGLLFLIAGTEGRQHKVVISRFPANSAILAEEDQRQLSVAFLERVFMRSATAYKAAVYKDSSLQSGFWMGRAIDKQLNSGVIQLSNYWIADFLASDFRTTSAAGTRRLAVALRDAAKRSGNITVKSEIAAAVTLAGSLRGRTLSVREFGEQFGLSNASKEAIANEIKAPGLAEERFPFDFEEFSKQIAYRSVELDSGGILSAASSDFDRVFHREPSDAAPEMVRFSTEGRIVSETLGKQR
jgi:hypothetical protein